MKAGAAVRFTGTATGTGPLTYQWRKDGTPIPGAHTLSYSIALADESSAGLYDLVVTGPWGSVVSAPATLTILPISTGRPVVMTHPANTTVLWGKPATLSSMVACSKPFSYEWVKVGQPDQIVDSGSSAAGTGLILKYTVPATKDVHEGIYELVLRDEFGVVSETTRPGAIRLNLAFGDARLQLKGWSLDLSMLQTDLLATVVLPLSIAPNEVLNIGVKTAAPATYSWLHRTGNGIITRLPTQTGPVLNFKDVVRLRGYYVLTITTAGVTRSLTFQALSFTTSNLGTGALVAPLITYPPEPLTVPVGSPADFGVVATGSVAGYRWGKIVGGLDTELFAVGSSPWLTFDAVTQQDAGTYFVEVLDANPANPVDPSLRKTVVLSVVPAGE